MEKLPAKANGDDNENSAHAIFLDHRKLINDILSFSLIDVDGMKYKVKLKKELFQYLPKSSHQTDLQTNPRKRKRLSASKTPSVQSDSIDHYLDSLPKPDRDDITASCQLPRLWENPYSLPQLYGANTSGCTQRFRNSADANGTSYLVPNNSRFYNHNVDQLGALMPQLLPTYDIIILDPPWRNKYIRRIKRANEDLGYAMLDNERLSTLPLSQLINKHTLVAIWCTNAIQHQNALTTQFLPSWNLCLLHKLRWYKLNTDYRLVGPIQEYVTQKQPYEMLYIACHSEGLAYYSNVGLKQTELLLSVPSIVHSHKPPLVPWLSQYVQLQVGQTEPECLELFARYLQPNCTSIGLEVLKLMDDRLYDLQSLDSPTTKDSNKSLNLYILCTVLMRANADNYVVLGARRENSFCFAPMQNVKHLGVWILCVCVLN